MEMVRFRLDAIAALGTGEGDGFVRAEAAALHGRKVIEAIGFACLVAIENGAATVPRSAKGQWNAESIFKDLQSKGLDVLPSPSVLRRTTAEEAASGAEIVVDGQPERRLTHKELAAIYRELHVWLHEPNPYVHLDSSAFYARKSEALWADLGRLALFMERHAISIHGKAFFCTLRDSHDGKTKVVLLERECL